MRAFQVTDHKTAPQIDDIPMPEPKQGEVRIRVHACGLNFADLLMINGTYQATPPLPFTLGMEMAGVVDALGPETADPAVGTRVALCAGHGGLAEAVCVPASLATPIPDEMSFEHAAAFPVAYGTSHVALNHRAKLQAGETLLVLGAAGGVGLTAVEIGKLMGATVIACARGSDKLAVAKAAGADHTIDSDSDDLRDVVKSLGGADVVYDPVGGDLFQSAFRACNPEARIITIGFASGNVPQIKANHLLVKNITVHGIFWGGYTHFRPQVLADSHTQLMQWYQAGQIKPHISHSFPLDHAPAALDTLRKRKSTGKVVVTMPDAMLNS